MKEYAHYSNYPKSQWRWPDFSPIELRSKSDNKLAIDEDAMDKLQHLRNLIDKPMAITSAYRSPAHNKRVKGAKSSMHLRAKAFDIQMANHDPAQFEAAARECGFTGFGFYHDSGFMHIDTGSAREWGLRWFPIAKSYHHQPNVIPDMAQMPDNDEIPPITAKGAGLGSVVLAAVLAASTSVVLFIEQIKEFIHGFF